MELIDDQMLKDFLIYAKKIAGDRDFGQTGILDRNDITQEAYAAVLKALTRIDSDEMDKLPPDEKRALIWAYVKKSFNLELTKQINIARDGIRACRMNGMMYEEEKEVELVFVPGYFDNDKPTNYGVDDEEYSAHDIEKLGIALEEVMAELLDYDEIKVINRSFGLDMDKMTIQEIADEMECSKNTINRLKKSALDKLRTDEAKAIIQDSFFTESMYKC